LARALEPGACGGLALEIAEDLRINGAHANSISDEALLALFSGR
jgi:hypothetical protein